MLVTMELSRCANESYSASGRRNSHHFLSVRSEQLMHQLFIQSLLFLTSSLYLALTAPNYGLTAVLHFMMTEGIPPLVLRSRHCLWCDLHTKQRNSGNSIFYILRGLPSLQTHRTGIQTSAEMQMVFSDTAFLVPCTIYWWHLIHHWRTAQENRVNNTQVNFFPFSFDHKGWNSNENHRAAPKELFERKNMEK